VQGASSSDFHIVKHEQNQQACASMKHADITNGRTLHAAAKYGQACSPPRLTVCTCDLKHNPCYVLLLCDVPPIHAAMPVFSDREYLSPASWTSAILHGQPIEPVPQMSSLWYQYVRGSSTENVFLPWLVWKQLCHPVRCPGSC
jgi:hypothetical protein